MAEGVHEILSGKVQLYRRPDSQAWWCRASIGGRQHRSSTKQTSLSLAKDIAEDWYLTLRGKAAAGELKAGKTFKYAAERFIEEFEVVTQGQRSPLYVSHHRRRLKVHLIPFFGNKVLSEITPGLVQAYRYHRIKTNHERVNRSKKADDPVNRAAESEENLKAPARSTLHQEIVCLRQVLKFANRQGWIPFVPDLSPPYRGSTKISHRAWFSPEEYDRLYEATRKRANEPEKERWRTACEELHDYVLIMVNSGLRPDEARRIELRDVEIVADGPRKEKILHIAVRGKRGVGYCKTMNGAVFPFQRLKARRDRLAREAAEMRHDPDAANAAMQPTDLLFPTIQRELFNTILNELGLKKDREGNPRTTYSLRHTYISMRLMEGADIYQIAKNCRTSVEMIEKYYASHIKNVIDARAVNVRKAKRKPQDATQEAA